MQMSTIYRLSHWGFNRTENPFVWRLGDCLYTLEDAVTYCDDLEWMARHERKPHVRKEVTHGKP